MTSTYAGGASGTLRGTPVVAAPGKVFLMGEYAVLEGGTAVLAAIARHAVAQYVPDLAAETPLIEKTVERAIAALGDLATALPPGSALVDTAALRLGERKLGLGSSAAAAVAAAGTVWETAGRPLAGNRGALFAVADEVHREIQGGVGSGADVAASVHGGYLSFVRTGAEAPVITPLRAPDGLKPVVFWTGQPAATVDLVGAVRSFARSSPVAYQWLVDEMKSSARRFVAAFSAARTEALIAEVDAYARLLDELGDAAEVEIVTAPFRAAAEEARRLGGAAKPSGAGGGDVGVALFPSATQAVEFSRRCPAPLSVLDVSVDLRGAHRRSPKPVTLT